MGSLTLLIALRHANGSREPIGVVEGHVAGQRGPWRRRRQSCQRVVPLPIDRSVVRWRNSVPFRVRHLEGQLKVIRVSSVRPISVRSRILHSNLDLLRRLGLFLSLLPVDLKVPLAAVFADLANFLHLPGTGSHASSVWLTQNDVTSVGWIAVKSENAGGVPSVRCVATYFELLPHRVASSENPRRRF